MSKYVLIPDSFKGTMSSAEICSVIAEELRRVHPDAEILEIPVADGGEGTVDAFLTAVGGERVQVPAHGPYMEEITSFYGRLSDGTAVVEMAAAAGLPMVGSRLCADQTTTYGVGELIATAVRDGAKRIVIGLGGSATNDGGCGAAAALGVEFFNKLGERFIPVGGTLADIDRIDTANLEPGLKNVEIISMCDIDNPLCGPTGASAVFGPQKGATPAMVKSLDEGLHHMAEIVQRDLGVDVLTLPGGGAAGGMGAGMVAYLGSRIQMGIEAVLDTVKFNTIAPGADLVFTGEGKLDSQSLQGKVVIGVARRAKTLGVPVVALVGASETEISGAYEAGVTGVFPINPMPKCFDDVKYDCFTNLRFTARNLIHFLSQIKS